MTFHPYKIQHLSRQKAQALARRHGDKDPSSVTTATVVRAPMTFHKYGEFKPQGNLYGNCGMSFFYVFNHRRGDAAFNFGFTLNRTAYEREYSWSWRNKDNGKYYHFDSKVKPLHPPRRHWERYTGDFHTGVGRVEGIVDLRAYTRDGFCEGAPEGQNRITK